MVKQDNYFDIIELSLGFLCPYLKHAVISIASNNIQFKTCLLNLHEFNHA